MKKKAVSFVALDSPSSPSAISYWAVVMALVATGSLAYPALAADVAVNDQGVKVAQAGSSASRVSPSAKTGPIQATPPVAGAGGTGGLATYTLKPPPRQFQNPYAVADQLKYRGWIVPLPPAFDTLDQGLFGLRNKLAENGISYFGFSTSTFQDNLLRHGLPPENNRFGPRGRDAQQYAGQLPTWSTANTLFLMYDLRRYGIPDGQITGGVSYLQTNWNPGDPNGIGLAQLSYYQTLFNKRVEIKAGYLTNNLEFLGTQVAGNIGAGLFGVSAAIPFEEGQNLGSFPTPGVNVKVNFPDHIYTKLGVQRGTSPDGLVSERLQNPSSVRFVVPNDGVFVIDETGYRVNAAPGQLSTWVRAAANYTSSRYRDFTTGERHNPNYGLYFLADHQLFKTAPNGGPRTAYQGLYAGLSVMYGPSYFNAFSQYYEARVYGFGLIPGRPFDLLSLIVNRNVFSEDLVRVSRGFGQLAHDNTNTYTASYDVHVLHGVSLTLGTSYTDHPTPVTYTRRTGSSLSFLSNLFVWF